MTAWLGRELVRPRTLFLGLIAAAFEAYNLAQLRGSGLNGWDVIYPTVVEDHFVVMMGLLWWNFILINNTRVMAPLEVIIRHGSRLRISLVTLRRNSAQFGVGCLAVGIVSFLLGLPAGLSSNWGSAAETGAKSNTVITYYTTLSGARLFPSPWVAVAVLVIFTGIAFLGLSAAHTALSVSDHARWAGTASIVLYVWSTACSFGVAATLPPVFDTVTLFDDEWAISQHLLYVVPNRWRRTVCGCCHRLPQHLTGAALDTMADVRTITLTAVGFLFSTWIVTAIGLLLATLLPGIQSWFWVVAGGIIAGYAPFIPLGSFNVFALFSARFTAEPSFPTFSFVFAAALLAALVLALLSVSVWFVRRVYTSGPAPIGSR